MHINTAPLGIQVDLTQTYNNAASARLLSKIMTQSAVEVGCLLEMLPQAGIHEIGGLLDVRA